MNIFLKRVIFNQMNIRAWKLTQKEVVLLLGSGRCSGVEHTPHYQDVVDSNPGRYGFFISLYPLDNLVLKSVPRGSAALLIFLFKMAS